MRKNYVFLLLVLFVISSAVKAEDTSASTTKKPKNIIIMVGDGMGFNQVASASLYYTGNEEGFYWQRFSEVLAVSTFPSGGEYSTSLSWSDFDYVRSGSTDSAAAATALFCGVKTNNGSLGKDTKGNNVRNIMEVASDKGLSTGSVTSVELCHATPAGFVAHNENRYNYAAIALEMFESSCDVIMGAGHPFYDDDGNKRRSPISYQFVGGELTYNRLKAGKYGKVITKRKKFQKYANGKTPDRLIGIAPSYQTLQYYRSSTSSSASSEKLPFEDPVNENMPTLEEMTLAALNVLDDNEKGFVLLVEGGAIDWASHDNNSVRLIEEIVSFNAAVEAVIQWVTENSNWNDTLLIVTADHETGYLTASGANSALRIPASNGIGKLPQMAWNSGKHTNQLVPIYIEGSVAKNLAKLAISNDLKRNRYLDNTDVAKYVFKLLGN